jgi:hypothetical protein
MFNTALLVALYLYHPQSASLFSFCSRPPPPPPLYTDIALTSTDKNSITSAHNSYRFKHQAGSLTWPTTTPSPATYALSEARLCNPTLSTQTAYGSNKRHWQVDANLTRMYQDMVEAWYNQSLNYSYTDPSSVSMESVRDFAQVVWKGTTTIGCGRVLCTQNNPDSAFAGQAWHNVVCYYSPRPAFENREAWTLNVLPIPPPPPP